LHECGPETLRRLVDHGLNGGRIERGSPRSGRFTGTGEQTKYGHTPHATGRRSSASGHARDQPDGNRSKATMVTGKGDSTVHGSRPTDRHVSTYVPISPRARHTTSGIAGCTIQ
jgi:hypothetical protein